MKYIIDKSDIQTAYSKYTFLLNFENEKFPEKKMCTKYYEVEIISNGHDIDYIVPIYSRMRINNDLTIKCHIEVEVIDNEIVVLACVKENNWKLKNYQNLLSSNSLKFTSLK